MTPLLFIAIAAAGGAGAALRLLVDGLVRRGRATVLPVGTLVINVTGSFALGVVTAIAADGLLPAPIALVLGAGLLGGYTTFSTASFETVRLVHQRRWIAALATGVGMLGLSLAAAAAGLALGALLTPA